MRGAAVSPCRHRAPPHPLRPVPSRPVLCGWGFDAFICLCIYLCIYLCVYLCVYLFVYFDFWWDEREQVAPVVPAGGWGGVGAGGTAGIGGQACRARAVGRASGAAAEGRHGGLQLSRSLGGHPGCSPPRLASPCNADVTQS